MYISINQTNNTNELIIYHFTWQRLYEKCIQFKLPYKGYQEYKNVSINPLINV